MLVGSLFGFSFPESYPHHSTSRFALKCTSSPIETSALKCKYGALLVAGDCPDRREVLGMTIGNSEAEPFWTDFLRSLTRRGLRGVKLVVSDAP